MHQNWFKGAFCYCVSLCLVSQAGAPIKGNINSDTALLKGLAGWFGWGKSISLKKELPRHILGLPGSPWQNLGSIVEK